MGGTLAWISGASGAIGGALADVAQAAGARVIDISRSGRPGLPTVRADLADPACWPDVAASFRRELADFDGERVLFVHAAGSVGPIGFAGEGDHDAYARSAVLNAAAPLALGDAFLAAVRDLPIRRELVMLTSGAASSVYAGWSVYGPGKAAIDQWVRDVGAEQEQRGGVRVLAIAPGTVATAMQGQIRETSERDFPQRPKFVGLHERGELAEPGDVARRIWSLLDDGPPTGSVVDLRKPAAPAG